MMVMVVRIIFVWDKKVVKSSQFAALFGLICRACGCDFSDKCSCNLRAFLHLPPHPALASPKKIQKKTESPHRYIPKFFFPLERSNHRSQIYRGRMRQVPKETNGEVLVGVFWWLVTHTLQKNGKTDHPPKETLYTQIIYKQVYICSFSRSRVVMIHLLPTFSWQKKHTTFVGIGTAV